MFVVGCRAVPFVGTHHEVDTHAHLGVGEDELWLALESVLASELQGVHHGLHIVSAHLEHVPTEGFVFGAKVTEVKHVVCGAINLFLVVVDDGNEVVDALGRGIHGSFPNLAFLLLAITHEDEDEVLVAIETLSLGGANSNRETLTKRARGDADARQAFSRGRMALKTGAKTTEGSQLANGEIATTRQDAVEHRTDMAVGKEKHILAVAVHAEIGGVDLHLIEIKRCDNVSCAQRTARVARLAAMHHTNDVAAHLSRDSF